MPTDTFKNETLLVDKIIKPPLKEHVVLLHNHFRRYSQAIFSLEITKEDTVIDASCGLGYGSFILAQKAKAVIGLDINAGFIKFSRKNFSGKNLSFFLYQKFKKKKKQVDKIVCIETYEHVAQKEAPGFLRMILSFLKQGGDLFIATPLGNNKKSGYNKYHLNEPSPDALYKYFADLFGNMKFEIGCFINSFGHKSKYCLITLKGYRKQQ